MIAEIGHFLLIISIFLSLFMVFIWADSLCTKKFSIMHLSSVVLDWVFIALLGSWLCLLIGFAILDFSMAYVAQNAHSMMPWYYRLPASWGAHEGSMMLWVLLLVFWWRQSQGVFDKVNQTTFAWLMILFASFSALLLGFVEMTSSPFDRLLPLPAVEGRDLNPLLQDWGLISHPPLLYIGYVGLCLPFFVYMALVFGREKKIASCAKWLAPHLHLAWSALTVGIVLGSWWAYRELGWGGWWFWDPVENISLMPWLILTAIIHGNIRLSKGDGFVWMGWLCLLGFLLSMVGTFLVRSGLLVSVHSFTQDPDRGIYLLAIICVMAGLMFVATWLIKPESSNKHVHVIDWLLISQQVTFITVTAVVALGTLYPLLLQVLSLSRISIGPPFYEKVLFPFVVLVGFLLGLYVYRGHMILDVRQIIWRILMVSCLVVFVVLIMGLWASPLISISLWIAVWIVYGQLSSGWSPSILAHCGLAVIVVGVALSQWHHTSSEAIWSLGEKQVFGNQSATLTAVYRVQQDNYRGVRGTMEVNDGAQRTVLYPEVRMFETQQMALAKVAIWPRIWGDVYVALGDQIASEKWVVRFYTKPFIRWIWIGGLMMAIAGLWSWVRKVGVRHV